MTTEEPDISTRLHPTAPVDLGSTLMVVKNATASGSHAWWVTNTPAGPASVQLTAHGATIDVAAWGTGAPWAVDQLPALLGFHDDPATFVPRHPVIAELHRRHAGLRLGATNRWFEAAIPYVIGQKVVRGDAVQSRNLLARRHGPPAPGPAPLRVYPSAEVVAAISYSEFHLLNLEQKRARTLRAVAGHATRLERLGEVSHEDALSWMLKLPGIGPWTAGYVAMTAGGDPDAVPVGDYHMPRNITYALGGVAVRSDDAMLEALEPYSGQRQRVVRLLKLGGVGAPRRAPRMERRDFRRL